MFHCMKNSFKEIIDIATSPAAVASSVNLKYDVIMISKRPDTTNLSFDSLANQLKAVPVGDFREFTEIKDRVSTNLPVVFCGSTIAVVEAAIKCSFFANTKSVALVLTYSDVKQLRLNSRYISNIIKHCMRVNVKLFIAVDDLTDDIPEPSKQKVLPGTIDFKSFLLSDLHIVLAMPTSGKTFLEKEVSKKDNVYYFDTDTYDNRDVSRSLSEEDKSTYLIGVYIVTVRAAYKAYVENKGNGIYIVLTNLWYEDLTSIMQAIGVKYELVVTPNAEEIHRRSVARGSEPISPAEAAKWILDYKTYLMNNHNLHNKFIVLEDDEHLSDYVSELLLENDAL